MSTLELLYPNKEQVEPYYQPIISLQNQQIIGYESLGREVIKGKVRSLGYFFGNNEVSIKEQLMIDRILREKSFSYLSRSEQKPLLFINTKPAWFTDRNRNEEEPFTMKLFEKYQIPPSQIVIEITEESITDNTEQFLEAVKTYRNKGCMIAIDDVGSGFSNFDRIALVRPDIIKVDLRILKLSRKNQGYQALLRSFSILATQVGASLLVEGVENSDELRNCLSIGARYIQGFLFSESKSTFQKSDTYETIVKKEIDTYTENQFNHFEEFFFVEEKLHNVFKSLAFVIETSDNADYLIEELVTIVPNNCLRLYICKGDGTQVSSNYTREDGISWTRNTGMRGVNWCWRPHFIPNILRMQRRNQGIVSHVYTDLDSNKEIQTFSYPISENHFLFMDVTN